MKTCREEADPGTNTADLLLAWDQAGKITAFLMGAFPK